MAPGLLSLTQTVYTADMQCVCCVQGGGGWPSWNWEEFSVSYPSLGNQLCIGGVYVRLLLEGGDASKRWLTMPAKRLDRLVAECQEEACSVVTGRWWG